MHACDDVARTRAFVKIGAASIVGGIVGGLVARTIGPYLGPRALTAIAAALAAGAATLRAHMAFNAAEAGGSGDRGQRHHAGAKPFSHLAARSLITVAVVGGIVGVLVDFQFYLGAAADSDDGRLRYFATAYIALGVGSLVLQLAVAPWLARRRGAYAALFALPLLVSLGSLGALLAGGGIARAGLRAAEGGVKQGLYRSAWERAVSSFPAPIRASLKLMAEGPAARLGEATAALALLGWMSFSAGGSGMHALQASWVAEVNAAAANGALAVVAFTWAALTLRLVRRLPSSASESSDGPVAEAGSPSDCCPLTAAAGRALLEVDVAPASRA